MNFCHNCGADQRTLKRGKFCYNCGNPIENKDFLKDSRNSIDNNGNTNLLSGSNKSIYENEFCSHGIIFTNLKALAKKLNCGEELVESIILNYIKSVKNYGHHYVLLDAGNNLFKNITAEDGWQSHVDLLNDFQDKNSQAEFLFILGGHDLIPMPIINNKPRCYIDDHQIETDMPYSYLLSNNFEEVLWNGLLFKNKVKLYCGRLPIPIDCNINELSSFLTNSARVISGKLEIRNLYFLTAKSWESATREIINNFQMGSMFHTSPENNLDSMRLVFNPLSDLYYFNLHGSDSPNSPEFFGDDTAVIEPTFLHNAKKFNFLITEACYGAKYFDYATKECMLLASLYNKTVAYVGSSKVAFGSSTENISNADVITKSYLEHLLAGETSGRALAFARVEVFDSCLPEHFDYGITSAVEFNLFGDPICSNYSKNKRTSSFMNFEEIRSKSFNNTRPKKVEIKIDNYQKEILNDVRSLVNQNIFKIQETINKELYAQFKIEPECLSSIFEITGNLGEITYNYNYYKESVSGKKQAYAIFADKTGKIKSIIQSK